LFIFFLPQRTWLFFVRNFRVGAGCLHVNASAAMSSGAVTLYDFDPTTSPKKSGKTPVNNKDIGGIDRRLTGEFGEGIYVVGADSRRSEIVWRL
jgi:hypothetical protein